MENCSIQPRSGGRFVVSSLFQYWLSGRKVWENTNFVSLALDAGRISGEDVLQQVFYSVERLCGSWAPPQVLHNQEIEEFSNPRGVFLGHV